METIQSQWITPLEQQQIYSVVCFGDSITNGLISANYVDLLRQRLAPKGFQMINAGVNGDHSVNLLRRIRRVIALQPDYVVILIGTNDINAEVNDSMFWISRVLKGISQRPTAEGYRRTMLEIVQKLKAETSARIALASPPLIGEDLDSAANRRARDYCAALREVATQEGAAYLPVHERQEETLRAEGVSHGGEYTRSALRSVELVLCHNILGESYDSISRRRGFHLVTDGIHMNTRGAAIIAAEIEKFLLASVQS
ncbi:MAG: SGNH/GDSL hydrolase family protein [Anaerolineae bacterium]|nr:SGNH/GDSL hydrolase family protein [Anaerolineae bacterium]